MIDVRMKELRKKANLSMAELGEKIGVGKSTISMYENGERKPKFDNVMELASIFHTSCDYLLGATDDPTPFKQSVDLSKIEEWRNVHYKGKKLSQEDSQLLKQIVARFLAEDPAQD